MTKRSSIGFIAGYFQIPVGSSAEVFWDLRKFADANDVQDLSKLTELLSGLDSSESPAFEAFGLKIPSSLTTIGGTCVVLVVQIYFFLYLYERRKKLKSSDEGWDVPWIGMNSFWLARLLFFLTVSVLPPTSLGFLYFAAINRISRGYLATVRFLRSDFLGLELQRHDKVDIAAAILFVLLSLFIGLKCWINRPQLALDEAPPPEYEI
jgi:hypothetical protein